MDFAERFPKASEAMMARLAYRGRHFSGAGDAASSLLSTPPVQATVLLALLGYAALSFAFVSRGFP